MDIDLNAIEKQLGIGGKKAQNDDDLEEDETLLAELMELQDKTSQSTKEQSAEEDDDDDDDETLLEELMGFQDETSKPKKVESENKNTRQSTIQQIEQPKPKPPTQQNEQPKPKSVAPTPAPPPSTSLNDTGIKPTIQQNEQPKPKTIAAPLPPPSLSSLNDRAKSLLMHRRKMYLERAKAAKEANDRATAVDAFETVKLFNQALEAMNEGAELTEEDLAQIPPSPPPYGSPKNSMEVGSDIKNADDKKPKETEIQIANRKKENNIEKEGPSNSTKMLEQPHISEELRLALMRQIQLKKEAMEAKKRGNIEKAKEFLTLAHRMDQMIEAAKCGLPIDIQQIPAVQSTSKAMTPNSLKRSTIGSDTLRKCQLLERELLKQIEFCQEKAAQFQTVGDSKNILFYEELQRKCKVDLHIVQMAMLGNSTLPGFSFGEILLPNIELNPSIGEDQLQLKISRIENLQLPQGWKPSDCSIFVFFKFPFPHGSQQTGRTTVIRGTISPEFPDIFQLKINRKTKQFARICKRIPLKLEIFNKGGFLRSDKPFGHVEVGLEELERTALIQRRSEILDGRKKTGGFVHVEIRINKPLGTDDSANNSGAIGIKRKWIELQH